MSIAKHIKVLPMTEDALGRAHSYGLISYETMQAKLSILSGLNEAGRFFIAA